MTAIENLEAEMMAQVEATTGDDDKLFELQAYCNRYSRQPAATYTGPKLREGGRVPQDIFARVEAAVKAKRQS